MYGATEPDTTQYGYFFVISNNGEIIEYQEDTINMMNNALQLISTRIQEMESSTPRKSNATCLRLDEMLRALYEDRILQEKSSVCGNILRDVKDLRDGTKKSDPFSTEDEESNEPGQLQWPVKLEPLKRFLGGSMGASEVVEAISIKM